MQDNEVPLTVYEGAGFLLAHGNSLILGERVKKPEDLLKDGTIEFEYMGGKPEAVDGGDPYQTALRELREEIGADILDEDWKSRVVEIPIFQPFTKKWIRCLFLRLNDAEFARLKLADAALNNWTLQIRQSLSALVVVSIEAFVTMMTSFAAIQASKNRLNDAKAFRETGILKGLRVSNDAPVAHPLRAFNTVIFESNLPKIASQFPQK
jgi:hypothetical protein